MSAGRPEDAQAVALRPYGEDALLVDVPDAERARALGRRLVAELPGLVVDAVPSAVSVLVRLAPGWPTEHARDVVAGLVAGPAADVAGPAADPAGAVVEIPVAYDGADLAEVAARCGLTPAEVVQRHTARTYTAAFAGFAPGFVYLEGLDPLLVLPRRDDPRTRVPAGSVAIAADHTAVYPRESPGGWHLLGRTDVAMFDAAADPPARVRPGDRVRFVAVNLDVDAAVDAAVDAGAGAGR
ncbi:KipI family sensor histidine kinase inhibitor [Salana multivorans]|uniref:KipI family sensor histidine kinase inhibitor n=1 Tax=Salana multivorans TaxID=120377 RepID=A0A3N2D742_9MICO|nr:allophanate hydrolase subunit 1 [Salana multivorans]ROR95601.1 KipI family sensor histidine kinase inhibitor [Salana multivorans]